MKKFMNVLKMLVAPFVWLATKAKALFVKAEPSLTAGAKAAVAKAPAEASWVWAKLVMLGNGFKVLGKALVSLKLWTRLAVVGVFAGLLVFAWLNGHHVGHGPVPGLVDEVQTLGKENASLRLEVASLKADLAKKAAPVSVAEPSPAKPLGHTQPASAKHNKKPAPAKDWYSGIIPGM